MKTIKNQIQNAINLIGSSTTAPPHGYVVSTHEHPEYEECYCFILQPTGENKIKIEVTCGAQKYFESIFDIKTEEILDAIQELLVDEPHFSFESHALLIPIYKTFEEATESGVENGTIIVLSKEGGDIVMIQFIRDEYGTDYKSLGYLMLEYDEQTELRRQFYNGVL